MKRILFCFSILVILFSAAAVFAEESVPFENPVYTRRFIEKQEQMLAQVGTLFPEIVLLDLYEEAIEPVSTNTENCEISTKRVNGHEEQEIFAYEICQDFLSGKGSSFDKTVITSDFYMSLDFQLLEQEGEDSVYVWFNYTGEESFENKLMPAGILRYPLDIRNLPENSTIYEFTEQRMDSDFHTLELIHKNSYTAVYLDHHFTAGFVDSFEGPFFPNYGVGLKPGGEYAKVYFDNLIFRAEKLSDVIRETAEPTAVPEAEEPAEPAAEPKAEEPTEPTAVPKAEEPAEPAETPNEEEPAEPAETTNEDEPAEPAAEPEAEENTEPASVPEEEVSNEESDWQNPIYDEEFVRQQEELLDNLDTFFPRTVVNYTFDSPEKPYSEQLDGYTFSSKDKDGHRELSVNAYKVSATEDYNQGWDLFNTTGSYQNFYFHVDVQLIDQDKSKNGYLWFQYTDVDVAGKDYRCSATIRYPFDIVMYRTKPTSGIDTTKLYDLSEYEHDSEVHSLEMIRLNGYTSAYIDHHFIVGFEDGFTTRFSHLFGVGLRPGGEYVTYAFDNFILRRQ